MIKKNKGGQLQVSFAWIFAIIVGAVILFLAIYSSRKIVDVGNEATSAKAGKEISVLLDPLETGFESSVVTTLKMPVDSRIENECDSFGNFGRQGIKVSQKSFGKWQETNISVGFQNKYIFSDNITEGQNFYIFSKPFEFPFKISDLIYLTSENKQYCFSDAPKEVKDELKDLNEENILLENCTQNSIKVCFTSSSSSCDVQVNRNLKTVSKRSQTVYFEGDSLMYAAIFSDKDIYECQVQRLMQRAEEISSIYDKKSSLISQQSCPQEVDIPSLTSAFSLVNGSQSLASIDATVSDIDKQNRIAYCKLW